MHDLLAMLHVLIFYTPCFRLDSHLDMRASAAYKMQTDRLIWLSVTREPCQLLAGLLSGKGQKHMYNVGSFFYSSLSSAAEIPSVAAAREMSNSK